MLLNNSELESITGGVLRLPESYGVSTPAHEYIYSLIHKRIFNLKKNNEKK